MKILLLGPFGQVGWELQRSLQPLGEVFALGRQQGDLCGDLARPAELAATVRALQPDVIVNAAAYTAVDKAESEPDMARRVNATGPGVLAGEAAALGAWLVHFSSDYVFDGSGDAPRGEDAQTGPLSTYGQTKLEGEQLIQKSGCRHLIFRTSWVYAARGANFAKTMLRLAAERDELKVVSDQIGAPTGSDLIADVTALALRQAMADPAASGLYHLTAAETTSWHDYARHVVEWARAAGMPVQVRPNAIHPVPSSAYPVAARRPLNSRLCCDKLRTRFALHLPPWQAGVDRMLAEIR
jgi:dTDP-4-dehydrorhamnose reductase